MAADTMVVLSPYSSLADSKAQIKATKAIFKTLPLGDTLTVINGEDASLITTLIVPNNVALKHPKARMKYRKREIKLLNDFVKQLKKNDRQRGAMDVPKVLHEIGRYHSNVSDIVLMGVSVFYTEPNHPALDMSEGLVPSDGFILASPAHSPFGTKGRKNLLQGKRIHWVLAKQINNSLLREAVTRFWFVYLEQLGGGLVSFSANPEAVMRLLLKKAPPLELQYELDTSGKFEMQSLRRISAETSIYNQTVIRTPVLEMVLTSKQPLTLGIEWEGQADLDLYTQSKGGDLLFFGNVSSVQGKFYKDERAGSTNKNQFYETIEYHQPIELSALRIAVNVYRSDAAIKEIHGTLRLQLAGKVYAKEFTFDGVKVGNKGRDINNPLQGGNDTIYSQHFNVQDIVAVASSEVLR